MLYRFADCELDPERAILHRPGVSLKLQRRVFEVLLYLLEHRGHVVSKDALAEQVWQAAIANTTIDACIKEVRRAVGDSGRAQRIIATRHGFGYEFVAPVVVHPQALEEAAERPEAPSPVPRPVPEPVPPAPRVDTASVVPSQGPPTPQSQPAEKKVVTVLCCEVQPVPVLSAETDLDRLHSQMRALYLLIQQEVGRYGGTIQPLTGNRFLVLFGAPMAQEDHAQRAMLAALGLQHRLGTPEAMSQMPGVEAVAGRMGLHTGEVAVGGFADDQAMAVTLAGDTARLAAALQEAAEPGTMLCSAATMRLVQGMVQVEAVQPVVLTGQANPVEIYKVLQRVASQTAGVPLRRRLLRQFVGRQQELASLRLRFQQVEAGHGQVVGIVGEPGIGKSRLLDEFRKRLRQRPVTYLEGRCLSYSQQTPYGPILDILRQACGVDELAHPEIVEKQMTQYLQKLGMMPEDSAPYLLHLLGVPVGTERLPPLPPEELKTRIYTTFGRLARQASQRQPLIIVIEDLHWIDATSEALLTSLVEHIVGVPILLVGTYREGYRPPWLDKSYATQMALQPLTSGEGRRLLQEIFSSVDIPDALLQRLLEQADGNPFFLEELAWTVLERGASIPSVLVPDNVQAVLMARVDRLPPAAKHLLQVAAVIGKDIPLDLLEAVAEQPVTVVHQELERLQRAEFLYESRLATVPIYTFKHALTQEVAYQSLLRGTRQPYHQRIAEVLAERFPETVALYPEVLAHHYTEAGLGEQAIPYWQQAGQRALERSANHEAIRHFTKGLELLQTLPDMQARTQQELEFQLALGSVLRMVKGHTAPDVEHTYTRAYELSQQIGDSPQRFAALVSLWRFYLNRAKLQTARELAEQCFIFAQHVQDPGLLQDAHRMLGATSLFQGEPAAARMHLERGIALYDAQPVHQRAFSSGMDRGVTCRSYAAWALWLLGYPEQALTKIRDALALARGLSHAFSLAFALNYASRLYVWRREVQFAKESADAVITLANAHGFINPLSVGMIRRGWALAKQGVIADGIGQLREGLATLRDMGTELPLSHHLALLAEAYMQGEQVDAGLHVLAEALAHLDKTWERGLEAEIYRLKGECLLAQADKRQLTNGKQRKVDKAEECFRQALDVSRRQQAKSLELRAAMALGRLWQQQGRRVQAHQLLAEVYGWFTEGFETPDLQEAKALLEALQ